MEILDKIQKLLLNKHNDSYDKQRRINELVTIYQNDTSLLELLLLLEETDVQTKLYTEENLVDLGERRAYNKIKMRIFNLT